MSRFVRQQRGKLQNRRGAVMVETVIVAPLIGLAMIGLIQFSKYFTDSLQLSYAAYQASRFSHEMESTDSDALTIYDIISRVMPEAAIAPEDPIVQYTHPTWNKLKLNVVEVQVTSEALMNGLGNLDADDPNVPVSIKSGMILRAKGFYPSAGP